MRYSPDIVPKPWGYEYCAFDNGKAAVWVLHIARGRKTSLHCHKRKKTRLVVLQGEAMFNGQRVGPLEQMSANIGDYHQTGVYAPLLPASENGTFLLEIEEPSDKADVVRAEDAYGRTGLPIETLTVPASTECLRLSRKAQTIMGYTFKLESTLGGEKPDLALDVGGEVLCIYKEPTRKVSDCVADFVKSLGIDRVYGVAGGGAMHLDDSFRELFVPMHHEQQASFAAESYARLKGIGCCLVTTGPGGTNAVTGVNCAWTDSIPVLFISGQVTRDTMMRGTRLRQLGVQETCIAAVVAPITKWAVTVNSAHDIRQVLERAAYVAREGRPGPVWVDIPLDIQSKPVYWDALPRFAPPKPEPARIPKDVLGLGAARPVLVVGNGVHLARAEDECRQLVRHWGIPVVSSWTAADIVPSDDPLYIGRFGIFGDRAANFAVQNADLLVVLGSRLSITQTGHNHRTFARGAKIVMVDADWCETMKPSLHAHYPVICDVGEFIRERLKAAPYGEVAGWVARCQAWKAKYPVVASEDRSGANVNSFSFIDALCDALPDDAVVVTDMGTAFTCTFQAARIKLGQRWLTASGHAPMGYGLPGAIGAHDATGKPIVCIVGDGGLQFSLTALQTIRARNLPISIFVLDNGGYLTMKHTQMNHFGRYVGSEESSGVTFPPLWKVADLYGIGCWLIEREEHLTGNLRKVLAVPRPVMVEVRMPHDQPLIPRSSSLKHPDGSISSKPIEDLYPFLPRDEFRAQMIVPPVESL